ncbi:MAG: HRDC domain-containing protein [Treponema sp.]|nr:HRDC domain-containing protein [Treponema sp.]
MNYTLLNSDDEIKALLSHWEQNNIQQIALDFEGEFNLHCYGEHLCLIQIFDGSDFYLVDSLCADEEASRKNAEATGKPFVPFTKPSEKSQVKPPVTEAGLRLLLEAPQIEKLWFDCASDGELVWKKFGIRLNKVYDVFRVAKVLGLVGPGLAGNLAALTERFVTGTAEKPQQLQQDTQSKKRLQQTNWMNRPLSDAQLEYALKDVANLFALRQALDEQARSRRLLSQVRATMKGIPHLSKEKIPGYMKMPGYKRMKVHQQIFLRHFFEARDLVARQLNKPPFQVLDKHLLIQLAQKAPLVHGQLTAELGTKTQAARMLLPLLEEANKAAQDEITGSGKSSLI